MSSVGAESRNRTSLECTIDPSLSRLMIQPLTFSLCPRSIPNSPFSMVKSFFLRTSLGTCTIHLWPNLLRLSILFALLVSLVHGVGVLSDVFIRITAAYLAACDQYPLGRLESSRRVAVISFTVRTVLSAAPLSSGVYLGEV